MLYFILRCTQPMFALFKKYMYASQVWLPMWQLNIFGVEGVQSYFNRCVPQMENLRLFDKIEYLGIKILV